MEISNRDLEKYSTLKKIELKLYIAPPVWKDSVYSLHVPHTPLLSTIN